MTCNETIDSIIAEMREFADADSQDIGRDVLRREIQHLADRIEAAYKREATCEKSSIVGNNAMMHEALEKIDKIAWDKRRHTKEESEVHRIATEVLTAVHITSPEPSGNGAKIRETDDWLIQLVSLINGEISHYMSQGADCFSVDCGSWHIQYDKTKGGAE